MNLDKRLLQLVRTLRAQFGLMVGGGTLAGILLVIQAYLLSQTVARVFLDGETLRDVRPLLATLLAVGAARAVLLWVSEAAGAHVAGHVKAALRDRLVSHLVALGPAYTRAERSGELVTTAVEGIEELDAYFREYLPQVVLAALIPLAMLAIVFPIDPLSGLVLLLTAPLIPFFMILIGKTADGLTRRQWTELSRMSAHFLDVLQGLTTLKLFGRAREQAATIATISDRFRDVTMSVLRVAFLSAFALELLATISTAVVAVQIGLRLLYGHISFEEAFFVLILAPEYYLPLRLLGTRFHAGMAGAAAARRVFAVLETPLPGNDSAALEPVPADALAARPFGPITFDAVHVAYPAANGSEDRVALRGVSFTLAPGSTTALVGPSGAGKSTVVQLLLRFVLPSAGRITAAGHDLRAIDPDAWRAHIAWVPQRPHLFDASVADNIRLGRPDAPLEAVIRAAQQAHADAFIRALPRGYDTRIGEQGARLSGGQAQRLALARAFLRDAPFVILDEATSNLDPDTEALLVDAMRALMAGRTVLIIAHRLRTVAEADHIIVLDGGHVAAQGTHAALLRAGGVYGEMVAAGNGKVLYE